ncbi:LEAF RUST 10 DISEASE-RESISTANCE LOCUS RECEPTOR-LIKE PROTEIN KINASE-like 1.1 [Neltuma alba]|uniref:LEAF RUST 10 DISEASE-RESISTANCE LOCUS RECEPTOR-LIKE PROTEIN KINASE-like 1.1 n=1 Tax=Neltuma alba TaxID=207710 RepID=UPI0010A37022|nr:LEAF RUST 10 DISEASE-RESISTANCE LOCUS RECEPTOR-LIKE PROTEIN KINASE-like 1.1 [Prosopis alba]
MPPPCPLNLDQMLTYLPDCSVLPLPCKNLTYTSDFSSFLCGEVDIEVHVSGDCDKCYNRKGGQCQVDGNNTFHCHIGHIEDRQPNLWFGLGIGGLLIGLICCLIIIWRQRKQHNKHKHASSNVQLQSANSDRIVRNTDLESGMAYFGIPIFSYEELENATNNFDHSRELGSGGFGNVYHGKLRDGREVAVKRLYDHNYRRIEQFMNEVNILTRLRHRNLVSLYGCTSRHCRELLLVYEYIPNGTLSYHLHGELANCSLLPWPIRIKIAIETASALAYLHASDTIHRDVKTNNILLKNDFCVKVADFGLSRLFPNDVTHVSTAPQGTAGYVDPEYYYCYQLTNKSDVYSFGVVLIELISSLPAVDITRGKDEINLADLAMNKIQNSALRELVDPCLGFELDSEVRRMIVSVAELAFQCLQRDKELRPSMDEVLRILRRIESGKEEENHVEEVEIHGGVNGISCSGLVLSPSPLSPDSDESILLKSTKSLPPATKARTINVIST